MSKETASVVIRVYPSTRKKAKIRAARNNSTIAEVVELALSAKE